MQSDRELEQWKHAWQSWRGEPMDWVQKAQRAHRHEATLRASYWAALLFGALGMALAVSHFGVVSWLRLSIGVGALLLGVGAMVYGNVSARRSQRQLISSPQSVLDDLRLLYQLELEGWTAKRWLCVTLAVACAGGAAVAQYILEAVSLQQALRGPLTVLAAYLIALALVAAVGVKRVRVLRRELSALQQLQAELTE